MFCNHDRDRFAMVHGRLLIRAEVKCESSNKSEKIDKRSVIVLRVSLTS